MSKLSGWRRRGGAAGSASVATVRRSIGTPGTQPDVSGNQPSLNGPPC